MRSLKTEAVGWENQLNAIKKLIPSELTYDRIMKDELPAAEAAAHAQEERLVPACAKAEETSSQLNELKDRLRDLQSLKKTATEVMRLHREVEDVEREVSKLESELSATGSTATTEDIQVQLSELSEQLYVFVSLLLSSSLVFALRYSLSPSFDAQPHRQSRHGQDPQRATDRQPHDPAALVLDPCEGDGALEEEAGAQGQGGARAEADGGEAGGSEDGEGVEGAFLFLPFVFSRWC